MKKKIYENPSMEVVKIKADQQLLAGSMNFIDSNVGIEFGGGGNGPVYSPEPDLDLIFDFY